MKYLKLEDIKAQIVIEPSFTEDDALLTTMGNAAEDYVQELINKKLDIVAAENGGELPHLLYQAMLIMVDFFYSQNRGSETDSKIVPPVLDIIVKLYRNFK